MKRMSKVLLVVISVGLTASLAAGQVVGPIQPTSTVRVDSNSAPISRDFRIDVETNREIFHNGDVLCLTVKLLNDDFKAVFIEQPNQLVNPTRQNAVSEIVGGVLNGQDVNVAIIPNRPIVIGFATLTRLGPSPMPEVVPGSTVLPPEPNTEVFRLPLFGRAVVPPHSTRIISAANILIRFPELPEPNFPVPGIEQETAGIEEIDIIPAVGDRAVVTPGYYLLDCRITKIVGTAFVQAQKIVRITPRPLPPPPPTEPPVPREPQ